MTKIPYDDASFQSKYFEVDGEVKFMWSIDQENWYPMPEPILHKELPDGE